MKHHPTHHLYQLYYGGFKEKMEDVYYCKICQKIVDYQNRKWYTFKEMD